MSKKRAFVRYTKSGKIVPGSLILTQGSYPNGPGTWKEITTDLCCENENTMNYKIYTALLTQEGTNDPIVQVLENTLGGTPTWERIGAGRYNCTLTGAFPEEKTYCTSNNGFDWAVFGQINFGRFLSGNIDTLTMYYTDTSTGWAGVDINCFPSYDVYIEIRVYP